LLGCALHPAEHGWAVVPAHPYYAVTDDDGRFRLANVPLGSFTLHAWHAPLSDTAAPLETEHTVELQLADGGRAHASITLALP
jgi:hypothetical protein